MFRPISILQGVIVLIFITFANGATVNNSTYWITNMNSKEYTLSLDANQQKVMIRGTSWAVRMAGTNWDSWVYIDLNDPNGKWLYSQAMAVLSNPQLLMNIQFSNQWNTYVSQFEPYIGCWKVTRIDIFDSGN